MIPLCGHLQDAQDFIDKSHRLSEHLQNLRTDCSEFARSFSSWASDRKAVNEASLGKLEAQLRVLDDELSSSCIHSWVSGIAGIVMIAGCVIFPLPLVSCHAIVMITGVADKLQDFRRTSRYCLSLPLGI